MNRRNILAGMAGIFAASAAPAILTQGTAMKIWVPPKRGFLLQEGFSIAGLQFPPVYQTLAPADFGDILEGPFIPAGQWGASAQEHSQRYIKRFVENERWMQAMLEGRAA